MSGASQGFFTSLCIMCSTCAHTIESLHLLTRNHLPNQQVLLRERCLLVVSGEAYTRCEHSIPTRSRDAIALTCCNARQAWPPLLLYYVSRVLLTGVAALHRDYMQLKFHHIHLRATLYHMCRWQCLIQACVLCQAGAAVGDTIIRAERRLSLVFVHKTAICEG